MSVKRINITIPEEDLKEINEFCATEKMSKSQLIREAAAQYIANVEELRIEEKKKKDMLKAIKIQEQLRAKSKNFPSVKSAVEEIRQWRDRNLKVK